MSHCSTVISLRTPGTSGTSASTPSRTFAQNASNFGLCATDGARVNTAGQTSTGCSSFASPNRSTGVLSCGPRVSCAHTPCSMPARFCAAEIRLLASTPIGPS